MTPFLVNDFSINDRTRDRMSSLELSLSAMTCYPYPYLPPILESNDCICFLPIEDETREHKRIKRPLSFAESTGSNGSIYSGGNGNSDSSSIISRSSISNSLNSLPKLHFRDHIWTYTQRYLAAEAIEQATEAMAANSEQESENHKEDGHADGMKNC